MSTIIRTIRGLQPAFHTRTIRGEPVAVGEHRLYPLMRTLSFTIGRPGGPIAFGWVRHRPVAIIDVWRGETRRIGIPNLTRRLALAMLAGSLLFLVTTRRLARRRENGNRSIEL